MISYQEDTNSPIKFVIRPHSSFSSMYFWHWGLPRWLIGEESVCQAGDTGSWSLGSGRPLGRPFGEGNGNPLQYSRLGNPMDRGALWATVRGVANSQTWLVKQQLFMLKPDWPHKISSLSFFNSLYSANLSFFLLFRFLKQPIILFGITLFP